MQRWLIIALILILFAVVFALQNTDPIVIQFFFWETSQSPAVIIPVAVLFGAILGILFSLPTLSKRKEKIRILEEALKAKSQPEVENESPFL